MEWAIPVEIIPSQPLCKALLFIPRIERFLSREFTSVIAVESVDIVFQ